MQHHLLLIVHLLAASIWIGGHLFIAVRILPEALQKKDPQILLNIEKRYEAIGLPALLALVISGGWMALKYVPISHWLSFSSGIEIIISIKLLLLAATILLAISAQKRVIPALKNNPYRVKEMAVHIIMVTLIGVTMLVLGSFVRMGGL